MSAVIQFETPYQHNNVSHWVSSIIEICMKKLTSMGLPYKFIGKLAEDVQIIVYTH